MVKKGIVKKIIDDKILVEVLTDEELRSCNSNCESCKFKDKLFLVDAFVPVKENDVVEIYIENWKFFISTFVTFVLPLILFITGIFLGRGNELIGLLYGGIFVAISLFFAYIFDKHYNARVIITKVI